VLWIEDNEIELFLRCQNTYRYGSDFYWIVVVIMFFFESLYI